MFQRIRTQFHTARQAALALLLVGSPGCADDRESGTPPSPVVHLVSEPQRIIDLAGLVADLVPDGEIVLDRLEGERIGEDLLVAPLPWPPQPDRLIIEDGQGERLLRRDALAEILTEPGYHILPVRRMHVAEQLSRSGAELVPAPGEESDRPAYVRLEGPQGQITRSFAQILGQVRLRIFVDSERNRPCFLDILLDGEVVGTRSVEPGGFRVETFALKAERGAHQVTVRVDPAHAAARVAWIELERSGPPCLLIRHSEIDSLQARYRGRSPRESERVWVGPDGLLSFHATGGEVVATAAGRPCWSGRPEPGLVTVALPDVEGWVEVRQPDGRLVPQATDPVLRLESRGARDDSRPPLPHHLLLRSEIEGDRRAAFWLPSPSRLDFEVALDGGDRLRLAVGVPDDPPTRRAGSVAGSDPDVEARDEEVTFRVTWRPNGGDVVVLDEVQGVTHGVPWNDRELVVGAELAGEGVLRFETDGRRPWPAAFADPRIVRGGPAGPERPNLLVYLIDTLRADHLGCYGYERDTSPRIDALAADGFRFDNFQAVASWTRPATATLLTGFYPNWHGMGRRSPLPLSLDTLAETMDQNGYSCWATVANAQVGSRVLRFDQGFHRFVTEYTGVPGGTAARETSSSQGINADILSWLDQSRDEPFFLYLHSIDPHTPYRPPADAESPFGRDYDGRLKGKDVDLSLLTEMQAQMDGLDHAYVRALYDNEILHQDRQIGVLLDALEARGLLDDTVVMIISDHGEEFYEHGNWNHGYRMWEEQLRVPFVLWIPERLRQEWDLSPRLVPEIVSQVDFLPGLLDLMRLTDPFPRQGRSWRPLLEGRQAGLRDYFGVDYQTWEGDEIGAFRRGEYKLIWNRDTVADTVREQLFHLGADPREQTDLAGSQPEIIQALRSHRDRLLTEIDAVRGRLRDAGLDQVVPAGSTPGGEVQLEGEALRELRALGYIGDDH